MKNKICLVLLAMMLCSAHVLASAEAIATPSDLADSSSRQLHQRNHLRRNLQSANPRSMRFLMRCWQQTRTLLR